MRLVNRCRIPRCVASQVTSSPGPISPLVTPAIARSLDRAVETRWKSTSRARSKQSSIGASMMLSILITGIQVGVLLFLIEHASGSHLKHVHLLGPRCGEALEKTETRK